MVGRMTPYCDDPKAYAAIPDEFFDCLLPRRHAFPTSRQTRQKVVFRYGEGRNAVEIHATEFYGSCERCGTTRKLWRERPGRRYLGAEYTYAEGYQAPAGTKWDPDLLWSEWQSRHPLKGRAQVVTRPAR